MKPAIPRRIIFCIDITDEMNETMGPSIDGSIEQTLLLTTSRLETVQFLVKRYVAMNSMISPQDSYGIILLAEQATWYMDFTKDIGLISSAVDVLQTTTQGKNQFDADSLFHVIEKHTDLVNPDIYTQVLVFYGRTENVPCYAPTLPKVYVDIPNLFLMSCLSMVLFLVVKTIVRKYMISGLKHRNEAGSLNLLDWDVVR